MFDLRGTASSVRECLQSEGEVGGGLKAAVGGFLEAAMTRRFRVRGECCASTSDTAGGSSLRIAFIVSTELGLRKARLPVSIS